LLIFSGAPARDARKFYVRAPAEWRARTFGRKRDSPTDLLSKLVQGVVDALYTLENVY